MNSEIVCPTPDKIWLISIYVCTAQDTVPVPRLNSGTWNGIGPILAKTLFLTFYATAQAFSSRLALSPSDT